MPKFQNLSIKHKLTTMIVLTCGLMMVLFAFLFLLNEAFSFQNNARHHISALAKVTGINATAALSFQDPQTARELLDALRVEPNILQAAIYTAAGDRFAAYAKGRVPDIPRHIDLQDLPAADRRPMARAVKAGLKGLSGDFLDVFQPIMLNGKRIGMVLIRADQRWVYARMQSVTMMVAGIMLILIVLSGFISARLQRIISLPIETLSKTMQHVKHRQDYGVRVHSDRRDELGTLMDGFNDMLEQIQERDSRLELNRRKLEEQVALRTQALALSESQKKQLLLQQRIQQAYGELVSQLNTIDVSLILEKSLNQIAMQAGAPWGAVYLQDPECERLNLKKTFMSGALKAGTPQNSRVITRLMEKAAKLAQASLRQTENFPLQPDSGAKSSIDVESHLNAYPLFFQQRRVGVLVLAGGGVLDTYTRKFITNASRQLAVAIHNALTFEDLRYKSAQLKESNLELARASKMKSDFLANMSHELRTPLNAIIGFSELLVDQHFGELNATQQDYLTDILDSGRHLLSLINDILDLSKVEAGKMVVNPTDVPIGQVLQAGLTMIRQKALKHRIRLSIQADGCPETIRADERKVKQVIYNLLSNAAKFTEDGGRIALHAETVSRFWVDAHIPEIFKEQCAVSLDDTCQSFLKISVADTGIGIDSGSLLKIFNAFEQVDPSTSKKYEGTGLGLALCRRFIELHHGAIWAVSAPDKGSTFTFVLPIATTAAGREISPPEKRAPRFSGQSEQPLVLIADDDEAICRQVSILLSDLGCRVKCVIDGHAAVKQTAELRPDIVLLDLMLPGKDGWQVLTRLKEDARTRDIPVIICSAIEDRPFACSLGACDYLIKPVEKTDLLRCLQKAGLNPREAGRNGKHVLLVDDDPRDLKYFSALLREKGVTVRTAATGRKAVAMSIESPPAVILQDLVMPDINGYEVIQALRAMPLTQHIPVILLTAKTLSAAERRALSDSIESIVQKSPASRDTLIAEIKRFLPVGAKA